MKSTLLDLSKGPHRWLGQAYSLRLAALSLWLIVTGCSTTPDGFPPPTKDQGPYREVRLREGDSVRVDFPGSPTLLSNPTVRRDGKITVALGGEILAMGKTPSELEKEILDKYGAQLAVKQVVVSLAASAYPIFVSGAVLRPGKISVDRPLSVLEAVMEAGGFDSAKANLKAVTVLRQVDGQVVNYKLNLRDILKGPKSEPFYLKPADIVYVPEKFSWF